jgi:hypothetical protein
MFKKIILILGLLGMSFNCFAITDEKAKECLGEEGYIIANHTLYYGIVEKVVTGINTPFLILFSWDGNRFERKLFRLENIDNFYNII